MYSIHTWYVWSRGSSVDIEIRLRAWRPCFNSRQGQ